MVGSVSNKNLDKTNAEFWNELCGSSLALSSDIKEITPQNLRLFDEAYFSFYPYLREYYVNEPLGDKKVLEIGLGYGSLGQALAERCGQYYALDVASGPAGMMRYRLSKMGWNWRGKIHVGSALNVPFRDSSFDYVYSIGCLHHTGDLPNSISEVYRVLKDGGKAILMLYNRHSFRLLIQAPLMRLLNILYRKKVYEDFEEMNRALYDTNSDGNAAPHTEFVSPFVSFTLKNQPILSVLSAAQVIFMLCVALASALIIDWLKALFTNKLIFK